METFLSMAGPGLQELLFNPGYKAMRDSKEDGADSSVTSEMNSVSKCSSKRDEGRPSPCTLLLKCEHPEKMAVSTGSQERCHIRTTGWFRRRSYMDAGTHGVRWKKMNFSLFYVWQMEQNSAIANSPQCSYMSPLTFGCSMANKNPGRDRYWGST